MPTARATAKGGPRAAADEAWKLMFELFQAEKARYFAAMAELQLSPMQAHALTMLEPDRPRPMSELAGALHCDASNVTGIADRLEARGLVERRSAVHDRRVKTLVVTPEGAAVRERVVRFMHAAPRCLAALPAEDQETLLRILRAAVQRAR